MNALKIEYLYPEFCGIFGDQANIAYLKKCLPDATFYDTPIEEVPHFVNEDVDMIYIGQMTERSQKRVLAKLMPFKDRLKELIEKEVIILVTGNASELFGEYIIEEDGNKIECLNIFNTYAKQDIWNRYNGLIIGKFEDMEIVGFKSQFSHSYGDHGKDAFMEVTMGDGMNLKTKNEGIHYKNFISTYVIGPLLVMNPKFVEYLLKLLKSENEIAFKDAMYKAYEERFADMKRLQK